MTTKFPAAIDTQMELPTVIDNQTVVTSSTINNLRDAIIAIEQEMGIKPSGIYATIRARFAALELGHGVPPPGQQTIDVTSVMTFDVDLTEGKIVVLQGTGGGSRTMTVSRLIESSAEADYFILINKSNSEIAVYQDNNTGAVTTLGADEHCVIAMLDYGMERIPNVIDSGGGPDISVSNVGTGDGNVLKDVSSNVIEARKIKAGTNVTVTQSGDDIIIASTASGGGGGGVTGVQNVGTGDGNVLQSISGSNVVARTIKAGTNIAITTNTNDVTLDCFPVSTFLNGYYGPTQNILSTKLVKFNVDGPLANNIVTHQYTDYTVFELPVLSANSAIYHISYTFAMGTGTNHNWELAYGTTNDLISYSSYNGGGSGSGAATLSRKSESSSGTITRGTATFLYFANADNSSRYIGITNQANNTCSLIGDGGPSATIVILRLR